MVAVSERIENYKPLEPMLQREKLKKKKSKINFTTFCSLAVIFSISFMLLAYLCLCAKLVSSQYKICNLKETKTALEKKQVELELEVERLSRLDRIEYMAINKLGLKSPEQRYIIDLAPNSDVATMPSNANALVPNLKENYSNL